MSAARNRPPKRPVPVRVVFWSRGGQAGDSRALARVRRLAKSGVLPLDPDGRFYAGRLAAPVGGSLVMHIASPRPLRVWLDGHLVLDEGLFWRLYQREVRAAFAVPCAVGAHELRVEVGPRPRHPEHIDGSCPSRNRQHVMKEVLRRHPDVLTVSAAITPDATVPPVSLRFAPSQFRKDGVTYQHLFARPLSDLTEPPSTHHWSPGEAAGPTMSFSSPIHPCLCREDTPALDVRVGRRRLFVPVLGPGQDLLALRAPGPDNRVEPAVEVAGSVALAIHGPGGSAALAMPVYEGLGRLAPQREFRPVRWPKPEELRAAVPAPVLPDSMSHFQKLYYATWDMLLGLVRQADPASGLPGDYIATGAGFVHHQFVWDTSFTAIATAYGCRALDPYASLNVLYSRQFDGGYIHREHDVRDGLPAMYEPDFSPNPPIMTVAEWSIYSLCGNRDRLHQVYPALKANHQWLRHNRRLKDGTYWTTGLANGLDNSPSLGDGYPCLTAQMAHEAELLGRIAAELGCAEDAASFRSEYRAIGEACNRRLWSESMRIYSTSLPNGKHNPNKVVTAFWPLWAGVVPPDRAESLAEHLQDPKSFWRHHPIPSLAADSPHFQPGGSYWLGSTWAPTNYAAIKGFDRAGRHDLAVATTTRHLQCMWEVLQETGKIWENYCSEASRQGSMSGPNYCWSALGPVALLLEVIVGLAADGPNLRLGWNPPAGEMIGVRRLPLGAASVTVVQNKDWQGRWGIDVETDLPFTLAMTGPKGGEFRCRVGRTRIPRD